MRKYIIGLLLIIITFIVSCQLFKSVFGSEEAEILSFILEGMIGNPVIDTESRTVTVTVKPMDLTGVVPDITVSEKAELTQIPGLVDGGEVIFIVTAENGDANEWGIMVNVQHGVSFSTDGQEIVYTGGVVDSLDPVHNEEIGNGIPCGVFHDTFFYLSGIAEELDIAIDNDPESDVIQAFVYGSDPGMYSVAAGDLTNVIYLDSIGTFYFGTADCPFQLEIIQFGAPWEDVTGVFSGNLCGQENTVSITNGFFKLLRLGDGTHTW